MYFSRRAYFPNPLSSLASPVQVHHLRARFLYLVPVSLLSYEFTGFSFAQAHRMFMFKLTFGRA